MSLHVDSLQVDLCANMTRLRVHLMCWSKRVWRSLFQLLNSMIYRAILERKKHALVGFSNTSNSTHPLNSCYFNSLLKTHCMVRVFSKLHSKSCYYLYIPKYSFGCFIFNLILYWWCILRNLHFVDFSLERMLTSFGFLL